MSNTRNLDQNLLDMLKSMLRRLDKLEGTHTGVRRNDIRLGDIVVATETSKSGVSITNLNDKSVDWLNVPEPAVWSFSGSVSAGGFGPPHVVPKDGVAIEMILALRTAATTDTTVAVWFNNGTIMKTVTLPADETSFVLGINVPVGRNSTIYPEVTVAGSGASNLSLFVRFGYPRNDTPSEDESVE